jgi:YidC/Oxa1 family membrane protein insertase
MMDTQRLIALVVFSFSALLLWDAWQKHNAPKLPPVAATTSAPTGIPTPTTPLAAPGTNATTTPTAPPVVAAGPTVANGEPVIVKTDLFEVEINTAGGDIRRVTMQKVFSARSEKDPLTLLEANSKHYFITQTGLLGEGLPNHKTMYQAEGRAFTLGSGAETLEVRLKAKEGTTEVTKRFTFHRGSYEIGVSYDVANTGDKPIAPHAYFQFLRDGNPPSEDSAQTSAFAGVTTFTGPAVYTEESKFVKVDFADVAKGKQSHPKKAKDGWIAMVQHYFVSAWLPKPGLEREYFTNKVGDNLYTTGVVVPVGSVAAGAKATVSVPVYIGPQETERLEKVAPGLNLVVDYGWLYIIAAPLFWILKWIHGMVGNWGWAIILLTILIKLVFYPLNAKAGRSMAQMKVLAPKMEKLKQLYGDDRQKMNQAMMELYRTEKNQPARRLLADRGADSRLHRALLGAARFHRVAPRAVARLDPGSLGARSLFHPAGHLRGVDVRADEAEPAAGRPRPGEGDAVHADHVQRLLPFLPVGPRALLGRPEPAVDRAAVAHQPNPRSGSQGQDAPLGAPGRTIAAVATPPGRGGIGVVRVSGPGVAEIARAVIGELPAPRLATLCAFRAADGSVIDEGIALSFPAPHSYTGEDVLELQGHGGPMVMGDLLRRCVALGRELPSRASSRAARISTTASTWRRRKRRGSHRCFQHRSGAQRRALSCRRVFEAHSCARRKGDRLAHARRGVHRLSRGRNRSRGSRGAGAEACRDPLRSRRVARRGATRRSSSRGAGGRADRPAQCREIEPAQSARRR